MWTEEKIKEAADRYACDVAVNNALNDEVYCYLDVKDAFLAGAKFIKSIIHRKRMSQYLNIYIKVKGQDKPLYLTGYCRSSEVYDIITEESVVPYNGDGKTYCDLTCMTLSVCLDGLEKISKSIKQKIATRMKAIEHAKDQKVADSIIEELDDYHKYLSEVDEEITEISHLLWLARQIADCKSYSWGDFEGLVANIG